MAQLQVNQAQAQAAAAVQVQVPRIASRVAACTSWRAILLGDLLYPSVGRSVARSVARSLASPSRARGATTMRYPGRGVGVTMIV
eukprot:COSAG02_NODE_195_length_29750_cov_79.793329_5_plen_85_part_00